MWRGGFQSSSDATRGHPPPNGGPVYLLGAVQNWRHSYSGVPNLREAAHGLQQAQ